MGCKIYRDLLEFVAARFSVWRAKFRDLLEFVAARDGLLGPCQRVSTHCVAKRARSERKPRPGHSWELGHNKWAKN